MTITRVDRKLFTSGEIKKIKINKQFVNRKIKISRSACVVIVGMVMKVCDVCFR